MTQLPIFKEQMMTYTTIDELKNSLVNILHFHNLNQDLINSLLSDEFMAF